MSVNTSFLNQNFQRYDIDGNGGWDRAETAQAALNLLGDPNNQTTGSLVGTFVLGGKDGQGLFPDFDTNNLITASEIQQLAGTGGNAQTIEAADFQAAFPTNYNPGGSTVTVEALTRIASDNTSKFQSPGENPTNPILSYLLGLNPETPGPQGVRNEEALSSNLQRIKQFMPMMMMLMMLPMMMGGFGAPQQQ